MNQMLIVLAYVKTAPHLEGGRDGQPRQPRTTQLNDRRRDELMLDGSKGSRFRKDLRLQTRPASAQAHSATKGL